MIFCFVEYHFTNKEDMKKAVDNGEFIEWAEFSGNMYGTRYVYTNTLKIRFFDRMSLALRLLRNT